MKQILLNKTHNSKGGGFNLSVLVDDEDFGYLNRWNWHLSKGKNTFYAMRQQPNADKSKYHVTMHRVIMGVYDKTIEIDHIDHNGLNNQKNNLRICSGDQNRRNRSKAKNKGSKYLGVTLRKREYKNGVIYNVWIGCISSRRFNEPKKHFPYTPEGEIEAAKYYDSLAKKYYGEFANLNFK